MSILHLPHELSLLIFSFLSNQRDLWRVLGVCKAWRELGADRSLWRAQRLTSEKAMWLVRHHPTAQFHLVLLAPANACTLPVRQGYCPDPTTHIHRLCDAPKDAALREVLRRAVVSLTLRYGDWMTAPNPQSAVNITAWEQVKSLFGHSTVLTSIVFRPRDGKLSHLDWLPSVQEIYTDYVDLSVPEIALRWPRLRHLDFGIFKRDVALNLMGSLPSLEWLSYRVDSPAQAQCMVRACPNLRTLHWEPLYMDFSCPVAQLVNSHKMEDLFVPFSALFDDAGVPRWRDMHWPMLRSLRVGYFPTMFCDQSGGEAAFALVHKLLTTTPVLRDLDVEFVKRPSESDEPEEIYYHTTPLITHAAARSTYKHLQTVRFDSGDISIPVAAGTQIDAAYMVNVAARVVNSLFENDIDWAALMLPQLTFQEPNSSVLEVCDLNAGIAGPWRVRLPQVELCPRDWDPEALAMDCKLSVLLTRYFP